MHAGFSSTMWNPEGDWGDGLPLDILALLGKVGGWSEMKAMRGVNKTWQTGFELGVTSIKIPPFAPALPDGGNATLRFPALTRLGLGESTLGEECLQTLREIPSLRSLVLGGRTETPGFGARLTASGMKYLLGLPVTSLDLSYCPSMTTEGLLYLRKSPLTHLSLRMNEWMTDLGMESLEGLKLTSLDMTAGYMVTPEGLKHLRSMPLTSLQLIGCAGIVSNAGFEMLRGLPLTSLALGPRYVSSGDKGVTDCGFDALVGMPLMELRLKWCEGIIGSEEALEKLQGMPSTILDLIGCIKLSDVGVRALLSLPLIELRVSDGCTSFIDACLKHPSLEKVLVIYGKPTV